MAADRKEGTQTVYYIPPNYAEGGKILQGFVRTRYLIDACVLSLPLVILSLIIGRATTVSIVLIFILAAPVFVFGLVGYNGDPLSLTIRNYLKWKKARIEMRYDTTPTRFGVSPTDSIFATEGSKDMLVDKYEELKQRQIDRRINGIAEGQEYEFASDPTVKRFGTEADEIVMDDDDDVMILDDDAEAFFMDDEVCDGEE